MDKSVRAERTHWRDEALSERHRLWGYDCPAVDVDFLLRDLVKASALIAEEAGEEIRAANDYTEKRGSKRRIVIEAVHTAATALRFLKNIEDPADNE